MPNGYPQHYYRYTLSREQTESYRALDERARVKRMLALDELIGDMAIEAGFDAWLVVAHDEALLWQSGVEETPEAETG